MFTFAKQKHDPLFFIDGKAVYTVFKKDEKLRIPPFKESQRYLESEEFREHYNLTRSEGKVLKKALHSDIVPEGKNLKTRFYEIRKDLNRRLYNEIDLRGTNKTITWKYKTMARHQSDNRQFVQRENSFNRFTYRGGPKAEKEEKVYLRFTRVQY